MAGVAAGYLLKHPCLGDGPARPGDEYRRNCYSDVIALYPLRRQHFNPPDKPVPFAQHALPYRDNNFEYPALTGLFVWAVNAAAPAGDSDGFFGANAAGLAIAGIAGGAALGAVARDRRRLLMFAAGPAMIAYAFHNWDLLPVGLLALGLVAYARGRDGPAGLLIGLGAAAKVFPIVVLPALILAHLTRRRFKSAAVLTIFAAAGFLIPNLIVLSYAGADGLLFPWKMQTGRLPTFETVWYFVARHTQAPASLYQFGPPGYATLTQWLSLATFAAGSAALLLAELRRDVFRPFAAAFGCLILFLATSKVFSVQYMLWLVPFYVVVGVPWRSWIAVSLADMAVLGAVWALGVALIDGTNPSGYFGALEAVVAARYAALLYLLWLTRRASDQTAWIESRT